MRSSLEDVCVTHQHATSITPPLPYLQIATLPIDTAKVRLQLLQKARDVAVAGSSAASTATAGSSSAAAAGASSASAAAAAAAGPGMLGMMRHIAAEEGAGALYKGFWPAIQRQLVFASLRIGVYKQVGNQGGMSEREPGMGEGTRRE